MSSKTNFVDEVKNILPRCSGDRWKTSKEIFELLSNSGNDAPAILESFFEISEYDEIFIMSEKNGLSETKFNQLSKEIEGSKAEQELNDLLASRCNTKDFYKNLWALINNSKLLRKKELRQFMLYDVWHNPLIPYYSFSNGLNISDDEYVKIFNEIKEDITKVRFILFSRYDTRTEEAGYLLKLIDKYDSEEKKAVLISNITRLTEIRLLRHLQKKGLLHPTEQ